MGDTAEVDGKRETERFAKIDFERCGEMASDPTLSEVEKIGCPDNFRVGFEDAIWGDFLAKLPALSRHGAHILDIGPGCGEMGRRLIALSEAKNHKTVLVDHPNMLAHLPINMTVQKVPGRFPEVMDKLAGRQFSAILIYSVLQIVIVDANPFAFLDAALSLLAPGGRLLVGDIPNVSKLRRFLASDAGKAYHRQYMRTDDDPVVPPFAIPSDRIDDGLVFGMALRARNAGFDAWIVPQAPGLPLSNRREDLLIERP